MGRDIRIGLVRGLVFALILVGLHALAATPLPLLTFLVLTLVITVIALIIIVLAAIGFTIDVADDDTEED